MGITFEIFSEFYSVFPNDLCRYYTRYFKFLFRPFFKKPICENKKVKLNELQYKNNPSLLKTTTAYILYAVILLLIAFNVAYDVAYSLNVFNSFIRDFNIKFLFDRHNQINYVQ